MNYKKLYEESLERARDLHDNHPYSQPQTWITCEQIFPELRGSEDERIMKALLDYFGECKKLDINPVRDAQTNTILAWLEKQRQKTNPYSGISFEYNGHIWGMCARDNGVDILFDCKLINHLEKQGEKNHTDKVEPKFKVGDWITNGYYTWKVTDIKSLDYILQSPNGDVVDDTISYVDENLYLWTIEDAKDGDVLSSENPFIFRDFGDGRHPNSPTAYCGINSSGTFILSVENDWWTANDVYPATKEQRDILFQKMKEAGYEWDAEKKELRKIEQKLSWSEEDEKMVDDIIEAIDTQYAVSDYNEMVSWLKSLKPKKHWKPSEEQISMLLAVLNDSNNITAESVHIALKSLYNDLKKL